MSKDRLAYNHSTMKEDIDSLQPQINSLSLLAYIKLLDKSEKYKDELFPPDLRNLLELSKYLAAYNTVEVPDHIISNLYRLEDRANEWDWRCPVLRLVNNIEVRNALLVAARSLRILTIKEETDE